MLFNSFQYALFLPFVFLVYWLVLGKSVKAQNFFLFVVSYIFYGWWDWRFLILITISGLIDFTLGLQINKAQSIKMRKLFVALSLSANLGMLFFFKYYNFFVSSFLSAFDNIGIKLDIHTLRVILPVGISFYTFQSLSYTIDIYRRRMEPEKRILNFFAFISFFPQLVAGPIERAIRLLPQFEAKRTFTYEKGKEGVKQIMWGLFKKIVIADTCATYVNSIFSHYTTAPSMLLLLGAIYFAFQIYCDFSGYSDIALGSARLLGFELMANFRYPYFSRDIAEFWRRWHISLSTWFRDYLYIPLGGSKVNTLLKVRNTFVIFLVSGFWHGANWTFVAWGFLHALYFLPLLLSNKNRRFTDDVGVKPTFRDVFQILTTFFLATIAWIFFRADNITQAFNYIGGIFSFRGGSIPVYYYSVLPFIGMLWLIEWFGKNNDYPLRFVNTRRFVRYATYFFLCYCIVAFISNKANSFIYFQF